MGAATAVDAAKAGSSVDTLASEKLPLKMDGKNVMVGNAKVMMTDVEASNGVVHLINAVLIPPPLTSEVSTFKKQTVAPVRATPTTATSSANSLALFSTVTIVVTVAQVVML